MEDRPVDDQQRADDLRGVLDLVIAPAHLVDRLDVVHDVDGPRRDGLCLLLQADDEVADGLGEDGLDGRLDRGIVDELGDEREMFGRVVSESINRRCQEVADKPCEGGERIGRDVAGEPLTDFWKIIGAEGMA